MEWLGLVELLPVLRSNLIGMHVFLSSPACGVPERRVHCIARAVVDQNLSRAIQVCFVGHMLFDVDGLLLRELLVWVSGLVDLTWVALWVDVAGSERCLIWRILRVICWMCEWLSFGSKSP